jgi:hypothetical protein
MGESREGDFRIRFSAAAGEAVVAKWYVVRNGRDVVVSAVLLVRVFIQLRRIIKPGEQRMFFFGKREKPYTPEFEELLNESMDELQLKTQAHVNAWKIGEASRWDMNQDQGQLVFTFSTGIVATCPAQIIGTFDSKGKAWLWAWANPSLDEKLQQNALKVKDYGVKHTIKRLTDPTWKCKEADAWAMTALATKLCEAQGAYRGPAGSTLVFFTFGEVMLSKA